jgi:hypothetical protein
MFIEFFTTKTELNQVVTKLEENFIQINSIKLTEHGNYSLTVLTDTKHQALLILNLYFGE